MEICAQLSSVSRTAGGRAGGWKEGRGQEGREAGRDRWSDGLGLGERKQTC